MDFAFNHLDWKEEWNFVIFFDEKKFNLDGPDGCHYYFLTNIKLVTIQGGGCVMAWAGFCSNNTINFHTKKILSENYINLLQDCLILPMINFPMALFSSRILLPAIKTTLDQSEGIQIIVWPSLSPDLNPMENLWGILVKKVYYNGKQYDNVIDLENAINQSWEEIETEILTKLISSMHNRMIQVLKNSGNIIKY
jgi:hypothetical protein